VNPASPEQAAWTPFVRQELNAFAERFCCSGNGFGIEWQLGNSSAAISTPLRGGAPVLAVVSHWS
jgi:hypothetical protein